MKCRRSTGAKPSPLGSYLYQANSATSTYQLWRITLDTPFSLQQNAKYWCIRLHLMMALRLWFSSKLCSVCSEIDFKQAFTPTTGEYDPSNLPEWLWFRESMTLSHAQKQKSCPLCRMISKIAVAYPEAFYIHEQGSRGKSDKFLLSLSLHESYKHTGVRLYVPQLCVQSYQYIRILADPPPATWFPGSSPSPLLLGRQVGELFDNTLALKWLDICFKHHGGGCKAESASHQALIVPIRVIDIMKRRIVELEPSQKYVTLSYVWGSATEAQLRLEANTWGRLSEDGGLANHHLDIPTTVKDAMNLCGLLKWNYLWVDALCIKQDDLSDLDVQIRQMHRIYANSELTIVAAHGADSWAGLPGISKRKIKQHIETIERFKVINGLKPFEQAVRESIWNTRAWTLQEMYFSRRLIYLTEHQVYFQCHTAIFQEDRYLEADPTAEVRAPAEDLGGMTRTYERYVLRPKHVREDRTLFKQYTDMVDGYAQRSLSKDKDALNAFCGISGHFSMLISCKFFWGLPSAYFDRALLFITRGPMERNYHFPSWCWAGWLGSQSPPSSSVLDDGSEHPAWNEVRQEPLVLYNLAEVPHYNELDFFRIYHGEYEPISNSAIPKPPRQEPLSSLRALWRPATIQPLPSIPIEINSLQSQSILVFSTSLALIPISYNAIQKRYALISALTGAEISYFLTNMDLLTQDGTSSVECIVLATVGEEAQNPTTWRREYAGRATVMAIRTENGLSTRVDLAWPPVDVREWVAYMPEWKTVWMV